MGIIAWVIVGALAGWLAGKFSKHGGDRGFFGNILLGVVGALVGGFIMRLFGVDGVTGFNLWSIIVSVIGALVVLKVVDVVKK